MPRSRASLLAMALAAGLTGFAAFTLTAAARADPSPEMRAAAAALFEDARHLMAAGKHAEACPKLEESQRIDPGMGTLFNLATCYEAVGRTASAWVGFRDVATQAGRANQPDREKAARLRAAALEGRLSRLQIRVASTPGVEVRRDGELVAPALWSTALPLDPGAHKLVATAPGKETWQATVRVEQPGATVSVDVPPLADRAGPTMGEPPMAPLNAAPIPAPVSPPSTPRPWQMPLGIVFTAAGVGGLAAGTALGVVAKSAFNASNQGGCNATTNQCNAAGLAERSSAVAKGNAGTAVFVVGAVFAATGVVLWVTAPRATRPAVGVGPGGLQLREAW